MTQQLDLFMDGRDTLLQNDVIAALRARDAAVGRQALAVFAAEFPQHELLAPLTTLLATLDTPVPRFADHDGVAAALHTMNTGVAPAAHTVFGHKDAAAWLAPLWLSLAAAAAALPFNAAKPNTHVAYLLLQSGDGAAAEAAIAGIASWRRMPVTLAWMAAARFHQGGLERAWPLLLELAWIDTRTFSRLAPELPAPALHKLLSDFALAIEDDNDPDPAWFAAWLLITKPAMSEVMRETQTCNNQAPEKTARLIVDLLILEKQGRHADLVAQRKRLRDLHTGLYAIYMASR
jgi:hypothetical protein